ncbi:MAG: hypothetical protein KAJ72_00875 [Candidatus Heimdallarchaeota archaeon]|nr:hypothetical protein [Candidatus Heimdallarchaeota archaeon]
MGYEGITFLLFLAYLPLIWIPIRLAIKKQTGYKIAPGILALFLMAVWIVGFVFRTMFVTVIEHLIFAGSLSIIAVIVFEIVRGRARFLRRFKTRRRLTGLIIIVLIIVVGGNSLLGINKTMQSAR